MSLFQDSLRLSDDDDDDDDDHCPFTESLLRHLTTASPKHV